MNTQPVRNQIHAKVKERLTELYYSMRAIECRVPKDPSISEKVFETSVKSASSSPRKIPKISSYSPDNEMNDLPDRSDSLYEKLNLFYQQKRESQLKSKRVELIDRFNRINKKLLRNQYLKIEKSKKSSDVPKVPSLLIRIC
jgi:hypothetical protein